VDFGEGLRKARGEESYRRILGIFQTEGKVWAEALKRDFPPAPARELLGVFQDMDSSAVIIGAAGLSALAGCLETAARQEDHALLEVGRYRCLAILRNVLIRVDDYLEGKLSAEADPKPGSAQVRPGALNPEISGQKTFAETPLVTGVTGVTGVASVIGSKGASAAGSDAPASSPAPAASSGSPSEPLKAAPDSEAPPEAEAGPAAPTPQGPAAAKETSDDGLTGTEDEPPAIGPRPAPDLPDDIVPLAVVDFETGVERCRGSKDRFKRLLGFYLADLAGWIDVAEAAKGQDPLDFKNVTINFHAMKSASATVGAMNLSKEAEAMEAAGRREDGDYIRANLLKCSQILEGVRYSIENYISDREV
jgi:HPt (histidine-containing phosphotransfer) domain-containing protein